MYGKVVYNVVCILYVNIRFFLDYVTHSEVVTCIGWASSNELYSVRYVNSYRDYMYSISVCMFQLQLSLV